MDAQTSSIVNDKNQLILAAKWEQESIDHTYLAFVGVMTYRKQIATHYLNEKDENKRKDIKLLFDKCNEDIRKILGI